MTPAILQDIAFSVIGILVLIDTALQIGTLITWSRFGQSRTLLFWSQLISFHIKLALGVWLIVGARSYR
jgi:hypothetical protein